MLKTKILELRNQKFSYEKIAKTLNCSKSLVCYYCTEGQKEKSNSRQRIRRKPGWIKSEKQPKIYQCTKCNQSLPLEIRRRILCSDCAKYKDWSKVTIKELKDRHKTSDFHSQIRQLSRKEYFQSDRPKCCSLCGYSKYIEVCHIKAIKDFPEECVITEVNHENNLVALCRNCHWEYDHGLIELNFD